MTAEEAQANYAEALEQARDGSFISAIGAQQAAIELQNAECSAPPEAATDKVNT